ncbi:MAG: hypothetical protein ABSA01_14430 [Anaerolineales bacterium]|jgi:FSR family fosmidomycin resistance protein-like MFS transporter
MLNLPFLLIELLDELVFGVNQAAWPLIRTDLRLSYLQIGLLLSVPGVVSAVLEPLLGSLEARPKSSRFSGFGITLRDRPNQE